MTKKYDICVFGGCSIDMTYFQQKDNTYKKEADLITPGGKGSNQAVAASRAGSKVVIISKVGDDYIGDIILNNLKINNISTIGVEIVEGLKNDCSKIFIDNISKDNRIEREISTINNFSVDMIEKYKHILLNSKMVIAQMKIPKEVSMALINFCYSNKIPIIITPCRPEKLKISEKENIELLNKITYITANKKECQTMFDTLDIESCVKQYPNKLIVTLGSNGVIYHNGKKIVKIDPINIQPIVDTTGAGDTFTGNLSALLANGKNLNKSIKIAQFASAIKITKKSAQEGMPYYNELEQFIKEYKNKITTR